MQGWQLDRKTMHDCFTSEFFDYDNASKDSKIEDFDISQEYLKSDLDEKSIILREFNQSNFLKALEIYHKACLYESFYSWRKINEKQKFLERKNPKNMTKVFIKVFYLLNKKIRTKIQKSLVKIHNFAKNHNMETCETPILKGIKVSQNRKQIEDMVILINKMIRFVLIAQFHEILGNWEKTLQKIEIFVGSLNLLVNPVKRNIFQKLKKTLLQLNILKKLKPQDLDLNKKQKMLKLCSLKSEQISSSFPDYFDITSYSDMPLPFKKSQCEKKIQKSPSNEFNSIKSKKPMTFFKLKQKNKNHHAISEYQILPFQAYALKFKKTVQPKKIESRKSSSNKKPMRKIKSPSKDSITKIKSSKKQKNFTQDLQFKKAKQIISEYYDSKNEICLRNKRSNLTTSSVKSLKSNSIEKSIIKSIRTKSMKKQK